MEEIRITERISYLPATDEPLSSDVGIIRGDSRLYLFDVGSGAEMLEAVRKVIASEPEKETVVIISHFHADHLDNIGNIPYSGLYVGSHTAKYTRGGEIVDKPVWINDGIKLVISPVTASHCKGSLMLCVDDKYLFIGDSAYCMAKREKPAAQGTEGSTAESTAQRAEPVIRYVYNTQLLHDEIKELEDMPAEFIMTSHEKRFIKPKEAVVRMLKAVYAKRTPGETYIEAGEE